MASRRNQKPVPQEMPGRNEEEKPGNKGGSLLIQDIKEILCNNWLLFLKIFLGYIILVVCTELVKMLLKFIVYKLFQLVLLAGGVLAFIVLLPYLPNSILVIFWRPCTLVLLSGTY